MYIVHNLKISEGAMWQQNAKTLRKLYSCDDRFVFLPQQDCVDVRH